MAYGFVAGFGIDGTAVSVNSLPIATTLAAGEGVFVNVLMQNNADSCTVADNLGNVYTLTQLVVGASFAAAGFYAANVNGGAATITVSFALSSTFQRISGARYTGIYGAMQSVSGAQTAVAAAADAVTSGNLTPASQPGILFGWTVDTVNAVITAGTGFTDRGEIPVQTSGMRSRTEDKRLTALAAVAATFTVAANPNVITFAVFVPEGVGPSKVGGGWKRFLFARGAFSAIAGATLLATWQLPTLMEDGTAIGAITAVKVYYDIVSRMGTGVDYAFSQGAGAAATSLPLTGLVAGTTYYYAVTVTVGGVEGNYSNEYSGVAA